MRAGVIGSSIAGMATGLALAREGIEVTIFEADPSPAPVALGPRDRWERQGVPQLYLAHAFLSAFVQTMRSVAPGFIEELEEAGSLHLKGSEIMPPQIAPRSGEIGPALDGLSVLCARRPFVEALLRNRLLREQNIALRTGVPIVGLQATTEGGVAHVNGVSDATGGTHRFDVVIDATGRRSAVDVWLAAIGARPASFVSEPTHQIYFSRYYVLKTSELPVLNNGFNAVQPLPWGGCLVFLGDNGTIQVAMGCLPEDAEFKIVRHSEVFQAMAASAPAVADWVHPDVSEPVSEVAPMGNLNNHLRRLVIDGAPVVTGIHLVGDAAMITNPQYGRGVSHAACHGAFVGRTIAEHSDDPRKQALLIDEEVERMLVPSFLSSIRTDRVRAQMWRNALGLSELADANVLLPQLDVDPFKAMVASGRDPIVWHAISRGAMLLEPPGRWADDPEIVERIERVELPQPPAPIDRAGVMEKLKAAL